MADTNPTIPNMGSFRDDCISASQAVPPALFQKISSPDLGSFNLCNTKHHLNHGAFGAAFSSCSDLQRDLHTYIEENPSHFYDKVCLPLLRHSRETAAEFLHAHTSCITLVPNTTVGMKGILESLLKNGHEPENIAFLAPIYGATRKLLTQWLSTPATSIDVSEFEEMAAPIISALDAKFAVHPFTALFADHVASASARILPIKEVVAWCKARNIALVLDACHCSDMEYFEENCCWPDYFIMSTHKWLCNVKACAMIRHTPSRAAPLPAGISFGFPDNDPHLWIGMLDYVPFIVLAKALRIIMTHGRVIREKAEHTLRRCFAKICDRSPLNGAELSQPRLMQLVPILRLEPNIQNSLEAAGIFTSVKNLNGRDYLRISCFAYNSPTDYDALQDFLNYRVKLDGCLAGVESKRNELISAFNRSFDLGTERFGCMPHRAFYIKAESLRHPLVFYLGHTATFLINKLIVSGFLTSQDRLDPELESICAVGVDEMSWDDCDESNYPWGHLKPGDEQRAFVERLFDYREKVKQLVSKMATTENLELPIDQDSFFWILMMAIEHEHIHIETSAVIMTQIPIEHINRDSRFPICTNFRDDKSQCPSNALIPVSGGLIKMGRPRMTSLYGWDNEFGEEEKQLESFKVSQYLVSNAEYLQFMEAGGYSTRKYWTEEGWSWADGSKKHPGFWIRSGDSWRLRTVTCVLETFPWDWPAEVCNLEAAAFVAWKAEVSGDPLLRLISHEEWFLLRSRTCGDSWNTNLRQFASACPVDMHCDRLSSAPQSDVHDIAGNVWQHSCSVLTLMPGFKAHAAYDDFTVPTIDGRHNFILGGSWLSLGNPATIDARYGFRRHFQQFAGIRYVSSTNTYHSDTPEIFGHDIGPVLSEHFADFKGRTPHLQPSPISNFGSWLSGVCLKAIPDDATASYNVLILNGGAGGLALDLIARTHVKVMLTDPTANHLRVAQQIVAGSRRILWEHPMEGELAELREFNLSDLQAQGIAEGRLGISQQSLLSLDAATGLHGQFDLVVLELDLLSIDDVGGRRARTPHHLSKLLRPKGKLVLCNLCKGDDSGPPTEPQGPFKLLQWEGPVSHISAVTKRRHRYGFSKVGVWQIDEEKADSGRSDWEEVQPDDVYYESPDIVTSYREFHFGPGLLGVPNFPWACAQKCIASSLAFGTGGKFALDAGCGPGRTAIELASHFTSVAAFDLSESFVQLLRTAAPTNVTPFVADACQLATAPEVQTLRFDVIHAANLVDRLPDPKAFLKAIPTLLAKGGIFVVLSPFTWLEQWTSKDKWLGGYREDAEQVWSVQGLCAALKPDLVLLEEPSSIPFVIPDTDGSFQYTLSQCCIFGAPKSA